MSTKLKTINCTSCGAGLDVLGGGRVLSHACGYCGAVLDTQDNYAVLAKYEGLARPETPMRLGDTGVIDGVEVTVIGTLGKRESYQGRVWTWVEHQVFSPTHGYGWISVEDGHMVWTRKERTLPEPDWYSAYGVESAEMRPTAWLGNEKYNYFESGTAQITFIEGEFNFVPEMGAASSTVTFLSDLTKLTYVQGPKEREIEVSRLLPPTTWKSFGYEAPKTRKVHALQPYEPSPDRGFLIGLWATGIVACLTLIIAFSSLGGKTERHGSFDIESIPPAITFDVQDTIRPVQVTLRTNLSNQWTFFEIDLTDPNGETLFETGRTISFYEGYEDGESWSQGSRSANLTFKPTEPGTYTLALAVSDGATRNRDVSITTQTGVTATRWPVFAMIAFLALLGLTYSGKVIHQKRRWSGSDWVEEDDD